MRNVGLAPCRNWIVKYIVWQTAWTIAKYNGDIGRKNKKKHWNI